MALEASYKKHILKFKFDAGTSRGILREKNTWYIRVWDHSNPGVFGIGEAGPLVKLSLDDVPEFEHELGQIIQKMKDRDLPKNEEEINQLIQEVVPVEYPSIRFGFETALFDVLNGGKRVIFSNAFSKEAQGIAINGLVWMGDLEDMLIQITDKVNQGYDCIKIKIGSLNFERECDILQYIRNKYYKQNIIIRVDANGAFLPGDVVDKLNVLAEFNIHSIEQPIQPKQIELMNQLCQQSPVPIALDEELIGIEGVENKRLLLEQIQPQYIILKPTLVGGMHACKEWIEIAESLQIGWWITSALESNIGLNAICQFTAQYATTLHQGLGTGQLYENNIPSPLKISEGHVFYRDTDLWDLNFTV
ncbi:MAG: o-succinylbenzoate synthase [Cyclobacteriaceae bacterium]|nr:o-succinylbenzoate synthase [Cyclobacteriaceae bacterium]